MINICKNCGKEFEVNHTSDKYPLDFCCYHCYEEWMKFNKTPNCNCSICGKPMYMKNSRLKRLENKMITCSKECSNKARKEWFSGEGNHQFNVKGQKNSSFKGEVIVGNDGYRYEYCPDHPFSNDHGRVRQHRLIVERNWKRYDEKFFSVLENGDHILKQEYDVHHIDEDKLNNDINNLQVLTRADHTRLHNIKSPVKKDPKTGKFIHE